MPGAWPASSTAAALAGRRLQRRVSTVVALEAAAGAAQPAL